MSFKKNKYIVIKKAIDKDLAIFLYNYFMMQKQVYDTSLKAKSLSIACFITTYLFFLNDIFSHLFRYCLDIPMYKSKRFYSKVYTKLVF